MPGRLELVEGNIRRDPVRLKVVDQH